MAIDEPETRESGYTQRRLDGRSFPVGDELGSEIREDIPSFVELTGEFYRGEIDRTTSWRARLDQTTNWAVVLVAAILTWAFSSTDHPHYVILIGGFGVCAFLVMEATRYREYDIWRKRIRLIQENLLAETYKPESSASQDWASTLGDDLRRPTFDMSLRQALSHRLRRTYLSLLLILLAAWIARVVLLEPNESWETTASIPGVPGQVVAGLVGVFYLIVFAITAWSARKGRVREFQE